MPGKNWRAGVLDANLSGCLLSLQAIRYQTSNRIRMETEAVIAILKRCTDDWILIGSEVIEFEIAGISDEERRRHVASLMQFAREQVNLDQDLLTRARSFHEQGMDTFDSLHIASAERAGAVFLTTDDTLIKVIKKHADKISVETKNPVQWFMEVTTDGCKDA